jgi:hypothetical protein
MTLDSPSLVVRSPHRRHGTYSRNLGLFLIQAGQIGVLQHGGVHDCRRVDDVSCDEHVWQKVIIVAAAVLDTGHRWSRRVEAAQW